MLRVMHESMMNGTGRGTCPQCGSADATTLKMVVANGTSHSTSRGTATGWVDGVGNQPGHTETFSTAQRMTTMTAAAKEASPPSKRWNGIALIIIGIAVGGFGGWIGHVLAADNIGTPPLNIGIAAVAGAVLVLLGTVLATRDATYNRYEFPGALASWARSWRCNRCGTVFEV